MRPHFEITWFVISLLFNLSSLSVAQQTVSKCGLPGLLSCPPGTPCGTTQSESLKPLICIDNAICDTKTNVCTCSPGFMKTSNDFCRLTYNSNCSVYVCNEEAHLFCQKNEILDTNVCTCPLNGTHYSTAQKMCVGLEGTGCSKTFGCTDNAFCNEGDWRCYCGIGYSANSFGKCLLTFQGSCKENINETDDDAFLYTCNSNDFLTCSNGKCACETNSTQIYDQVSKKCVSLAGEKCDHKVTADSKRVLRCTSGATCSTSEAGSLCKCRMGLKETASRTCTSGSRAGKKLDLTYFNTVVLMILLSQLAY